MTEKARRCIEFVLAREGGYIHHPNDPGGETNYGISKRSYPNLDIKALTREQAIEIYERDYWRAIHGDQLPEPLALALMDYAVHSGPRVAWRMLASLCGLRRDAAASEVIAKVLEAPSASVIATELVVERALFLVRRALVTPGQDVFAKGWVSRMVDLKRAVEAASKRG